MSANTVQAAQPRINVLRVQTEIMHGHRLDAVLSPQLRNRHGGKLRTQRCNLGIPGGYPDSDLLSLATTVAAGYERWSDGYDAQVATLTERLSRCACTDDYGNEAP